MWPASQKKSYAGTSLSFHFFGRVRREYILSRRPCDDPYRDYTVPELVSECRNRCVSIDFSVDSGYRRLHSREDTEETRKALRHVLRKADLHFKEHGPQTMTAMRATSQAGLRSLCRAMCLRQGNKQRETMIEHIKLFVTEAGSGCLRSIDSERE